jgi:adenylosuccinate synthase
MFDAQDKAYLQEMEQRLKAYTDASTLRMMGYTDDSAQQLKDHADVSEQRMKDYADAAEQRMKEYANAAEQRMKEYTDAAEQRSQAFMQDLAQKILEQSAANTKILLESYVEPKFKILMEGHQVLLDTMSPKTEVQEIREEVDLLKTVVRAMSRDIAELKKAQ